MQEAAIFLFNKASCSKPPSFSLSHWGIEREKIHPTQELQASPRRTVISAKAEIHRFEPYRYVQIWIPAFAGMTRTANSARIPCTRLFKRRDGIDDVPGSQARVTR
jgi:hypothetical protein